MEAVTSPYLSLRSMRLKTHFFWLSSDHLEDQDQHRARAVACVTLLVLLKSHQVIPKRPKEQPSS